MSDAETAGADVRSGSDTGRSILRSILAVLAGLVFIFVVTTLTDVVMHATGIFPPWFEPMDTPLWVLALAYRIIYGVGGGYITARLAPNRPALHAVVLGVIGVVLSTFGAAATWNKGPEFGPQWFPISLILISIPCSWLGGKLSEMQRSAKG